MDDEDGIDWAGLDSLFVYYEQSNKAKQAASGVALAASPPVPQPDETAASRSPPSPHDEQKIPAAFEMLPNPPQPSPMPLPPPRVALQEVNFNNPQRNTPLNAPQSTKQSRGWVGSDSKGR